MAWAQDVLRHACEQAEQSLETERKRNAEWVRNLEASNAGIEKMEQDLSDLRRAILQLQNNQPE